MTVIDRRRFLSTALSAALSAGLLMAMTLARAANVNTTSARLLAAWKLPSGIHQAGVLLLQPGEPDVLTVLMAVDLPTRPHGLMSLSNDEYLVVARRPGDWMMRLKIRTGQVARIWQEPDRSLNGHSAVHGNLLYTTETDLLTGQGVLGVRNASTFDLMDVWQTGGHDPHEILVMPKGSLGFDHEWLLVANGGIQTHADMGRTVMRGKPMDSSLVALHPETGAMLKQWTLEDPELSLRHVAMHRSGVVGIALQAQHPGEDARNAAPVLAILGTDGSLRVVPDSTDLAGYAGDIAASREGFVISCTKADSALHVDVQGTRLGLNRAQAACALAAFGEQVWLGQQTAALAELLELDNHWLALRG